MRLKSTEKLIWRINAFIRSFGMKKMGSKVYISPKAEIPFLKNVSIGTKCRIANYCRIESTTASSSIEIGTHTWIQRNVAIMTYNGSVTIGNHVSLQPFVVVWGPGDIHIGNDVRIGPRVSIVAGNHNFKDSNDIIRNQGMNAIGITIEDDVWLGAHAVILDGVCVAKGCVVAASAVVTKSTEPYGIYAGVPAKKIGTRQ